MTIPSSVPAAVIAGVDFSDASGRALVWAQRVANLLGSPLVVATVIDPLLAGAAKSQADTGWFLNDGRRDLEAFAAGAIGRSAASAAEYAVIVGDPAPALLKAAEDRQAMIVVGTHGLGRAHRLIFGSTTLRLMRKTTRPVLAVPIPATDPRSAETPGPPEIERIICGVDFSASSKAAARLAHTLGKMLSVPVEIVHAVQMAARPAVWDAIPTPQQEGLLAAAAAELEAIVATLPMVTSAARIGRPEEVLAAAAAAHASLIVLGLGDANGHRPGSTAMRVIAESRVPVLTVPADAEA